MVIDAILYNGEREIFDLRYNILKDYVDEFIVVEFNKTFSGVPKEPSFNQHYDKIKSYYVMEWEELKPDMPEAFQREYSQREHIKTLLTNLKDDDIVVFSDCDEIWHPMNWAPHLRAGRFKLRLLQYVYYLNNRSDEVFPLGPVIGLWKDLRDKSFNEMRTDNVYSTTRYFGWHFTNMGGLDKLKYKIESYGHQEFNTSEVKDNLEKRIEQNQDYIGRGFKMWVDESDWPAYLKNNRHLYTHMLK